MVPQPLIGNTETRKHHFLFNRQEIIFWHSVYRRLRVRDGFRYWQTEKSLKLYCDTREKIHLMYSP